jgi:hypothetical protein
MLPPCICLLQRKLFSVSQPRPTTKHSHKPSMYTDKLEMHQLLIPGRAPLAFLRTPGRHERGGRRGCMQCSASSALARAQKCRRLWASLRGSHVVLAPLACLWPSWHAVLGRLGLHAWDETVRQTASHVLHWEAALLQMIRICGSSCAAGRRPVDKALGRYWQVCQVGAAVAPEEAPTARCL